MKKIYFFCIVAVIVLLGVRVVKLAAESPDVTAKPVSLPVSLYEEIAEISKVLPEDYKPWLLGNKDYYLSETDAHCGALLSGIGAGVLTKIFATGASGLWPFVVGPAAWYISLKALYIFTPTGIYCTAHNIFTRVITEIQHDPRAHGSFDKDIMSYVFTYFGDEKFPILSAHAYFKSFHDRLLRAKIFVLQCLERAQAGTDLENAAKALEKAINRSLDLITKKISLLVSAQDYLESHKSFHKYTEEQAQKRAQAQKEERERQRLADERERDRLFAAQAGPGAVKYTSAYTNK